MRRYTRFLILVFIFMILLASCSSKAPLEIISASAEISEFSKQISLNYNFTLKNSGNRTLGDIKKPIHGTYRFDDSIKLDIEPNDELKSVLKEIVGFNIFDEEEREQERIEWGWSSTPFLEPNKEGEYSFIFDLGILEVPTEMSIPTKEKLDRLIRNAMDATLVVSIEGKEIAKFDLTNLN